MAPPRITVISVSKTKISDEPGMLFTTVVFICDQNIIQWESRAGGLFHGSGLLTENGLGFPSPSSSLTPSSSRYACKSIPAGTEISFTVDCNELQQDGEYRINIYACNENGEWTQYE